MIKALQQYKIGRIEEDKENMGVDEEKPLVKKETDRELSSNLQVLSNFPLNAETEA